MLEKETDKLLFSLIDPGDFCMGISCELREEWDGLSDKTKREIIKRADAYLDVPVPALNGADYILFSRTGMTAERDAAYRKRRRMLREFVLATCLHPDGRYDIPLVNILWAICEESSWLSVNNTFTEGKGVAFPGIEPAIDRAAAETAADLCMTLQLISSRLEAISPKLTERLYTELEKRIILPFLQEDFSFKGSLDDELACISGVLMTFFSADGDIKRRISGIRSAMQLLDDVLCDMPADGSIPGGIEKWKEFAVPVSDIIAMVNVASAERVDLAENKQLRRMCHYPVFCHIAPGVFLNTGSATMRPRLSGKQLYRVGSYADDEALRSLGLYLMDDFGDDTLTHMASDLFLLDGIETENVRPPFRREAFLSEARILMLHSDEDSDEGLAVCFHGGENTAVGGHCDCGDVIMYCGGDPILIDCGFASDSGMHNLPLFGGEGQLMGKGHGADDISATLKSEPVALTMGLKNAYRSNGCVAAYDRSVLYFRGEGAVQIIDMFELKKNAAVDFCFITPYEPIAGRDYVQLGNVRMIYDDRLAFTKERIEVPSGRFRDQWGNIVYRLRFTTPDTMTKEQLSFTFKPMKTYG